MQDHCSATFFALFRLCSSNCSHESYMERNDMIYGVLRRFRESQTVTLGFFFLFFLFNSRPFQTCVCKIHEVKVSRERGLVFKNSTSRESKAKVKVNTARRVKNQIKGDLQLVKVDFQIFQRFSLGLKNLSNLKSDN